MSKTQIYWLLIIIPAILLAIAASCLLLEQQIKVRKIEREVDRQLAVHRSEAIQFFIDSVKSELETAFRKSLADKDELMELERTDPRVRSTAIWSKTHGFVYPDPNSSPNGTLRLLQRYAPIISGGFAERKNEAAPEEDLLEQSLVRTVAKSAENFSQRNFGQMADGASKGAKVIVAETLPGGCVADCEEFDEEPPLSELVASAPEPQTSKDIVLGGSLIARNEPMGEARRIPVPESAAAVTKKKSPPSPAKVRPEPLPAAAPDEAPSLAKLATSTPEPQTTPLKPQTSNSFDWEAEFISGELSIIGGTHIDDDHIAIIDLETTYLLSALPGILDSVSVKGYVFAVTDRSGKLLVKSVGDLSRDLQPTASVSLAPSLPGWNIAAYRTGRTLSVSDIFPLAWSVLGLVFLMLVTGLRLLVREEARQRTDAVQKTSFVSNVSHELKTPLTSIRLYSEMLQTGVAKDREQAAHYLNVISAESERLSRLVNNVLDFGRLEQNRRKFNLADEKPAALVERVAENQRARVEAAGMELVIDIPDERRGDTVRTDRDAVEQILVNLIDNAVKYASSGKYLKLALGGPGEITVSDKGPGIGAKHRAHIFERFYRCDDSITSTASGTGLGLSIAQRLIEAMGGSLRYEPVEGGGAAFILTLKQTTR